MLKRILSSMTLLLFSAGLAFAANTVTATIPSGGTTSTVINLDNNKPAPKAAGITIPSAWTTANLTFFVSKDNGASYQEMYDGAGNEYTVVVTGASTYIVLDQSVFTPITNFLIQSGTTGSPVSQGAARTLTITIY